MPEILQGNNTEARLLADERFLRKIAHLYYEDGNSQEAVAEMENCSRQTVGKALQKARERGIVRITVMYRVVMSTSFLPGMPRMMSSLTLPIPTIPFMRKWGRLPDNYEALYQEMIDAMQQPDYVASWSLMTAWGTKTSQPL